MLIDWTVRIGDVLTVASILGGGFWLVASSRVELKDHGDRLKEIELELRKQTDTLVALARQDQRLDDHERRLDRLEKA